MRHFNIINIFFVIIGTVFFSSYTAHSVDWQKPWSLEKVNAEKDCAEKYDHSSRLQKEYNRKLYLTACIQNTKEDYDTMQGDFGIPKIEAKKLKKRCSKDINQLSLQVSCVNQEAFRLPDDKEILKKCDFNSNGRIDSRTDIRLGRASFKTAKKEHVCERSTRSNNEKLFKTIVAGDAIGLKKLLSSINNLEITNKRGATPLIVAGKYNNVQIIIALLDAGAKIDAQDNESATALMNASYFGNDDVVAILLDKGADPTIGLGNFGVNAFSFAARKNQHKVINILFNHAKKLCQNNNAESCVHMGFIYEEGSKFIKKDMNKSMKYYIKGCELGSLNGCTDLYLGSKENDLEIKFAKKSCDLGGWFECGQVAKYEQNKEKSYLYFAKKFKIEQKGCDAGNKNYCATLVRMRNKQKGIKKSEISTHDIYAKWLQVSQGRCEKGNFYTCSELIDVYEQEKWKDKDSILLSLYKNTILKDKKSCENNSISSCRLLGDLYMRPHNPYKSENKAKNAYNHALYLANTHCDLKNSNACKQLAYIHLYGQGIDKNSAKGEEIMDKYCMLVSGDSSCEELSTFLSAKLIMRLGGISDFGRE